MQINETDGVNPSIPTPSTMTMRPSGDDERNEQIDDEARENDRRNNLRPSEGVSIDIMA